MSPKEGVFYAAWMTGIIIAHSVCKYVFHLNQIVSLIIGVVFGAAVGYAAERLFSKRSGGPTKPKG